MTMSSQTTRLPELARLCAVATESADLLERVLPLISQLAEARTALVLHRRVDGLVVVTRCGVEVDPAAVLPETLGGEPGSFEDLTPPAGWTAAGISRVAARRLPSVHEWLLLGWGAGDQEPSEELDLALALLDASVGRLHAEAALSDLTLRVDNAQQLANMGDYDWHIATDTNRWSDQLYRIYGHEPQSFNASYERFLAHIHPDDRERITGVHQQAYATGDPYQMIERIVRPDGEVRYLSSNGQVIMDESGTPVRMRGTCVDITDRVLAEQARERSAARFQALVESSPDAVMVVDADGRILQANGRTAELLGADAVGCSLDQVLPAEARSGGGRAVEATGLDGRALRLDVNTAELSSAGDDSERAVFLHDASPRLQSEALAASFREAQVRRRQALEINDNIVQGLTAAVYSMEVGNTVAGQSYLERTLSAARSMMNDLLDPLNGDDLRPGDLVRARPSSLDQDPVAAAEPAPVRHINGNGAPVRRVLIVDDYDDVRTLLRIKLESHGGFEVVGEAENGVEAVRLASELQPNLVLLDVAMPQMDGLEALPLILEAVDNVHVIVLSGFDQNAMAEKAFAAGASRYIEKGHALADLVRLIEETY